MSYFHHLLYFLLGFSFSIFLIINLIPRGPTISRMMLPVPTEQNEDQEYPEEYSCMNDCLRGLKQPPNLPVSQSLCSEGANMRGNHQKVVSFSFYGEMKSGYFRGIGENLELMQEFYPSWVYRLYIDSQKMSLNASISLCSLKCSSPILDLCPVNNLPQFGDLSKVFGMTWRFLPMTDPTVDIMVSRDLDSRMIAREEAAVSEWIKSDLPFHVMRDNPHHGTSILGGMWGARMDLDNRDRYSRIMHTLMDKAKNVPWSKGQDQVLLGAWVWKEVKDEAMAHDSYLCGSYASKHVKAFPTQRARGKYNFVGAAGPMEIDNICPEKCRPPEHLDWTRC